MTAALSLRRTRGPAGAAVIALALVAAMPRTAAASVDVADVHSEYDGCIAKFRTAGLSRLVDQLDASRHVFKIRKTTDAPHGSVSNAQDETDALNGIGTGGETDWNPADASAYKDQYGKDTGVAEDPCATLYHEMSHLADYDKGDNHNGADDRCYYMAGGQKVNTHISIAEVKATRAENEYRRSQHLPERLAIDGHDLPPPGVDCLPPPPYRPPRGCNPGCAVSNGDPHLTTFDQAYYDFQAVGEFVLTRAPGGGLEVQARQSPFPGSAVVSVNTAVAANVAGDRVGVYASAGGLQLHVGGVATAPSSGARRLAHGGTVSPLEDGSFDIGWPDGSELVVRPIGPWGLSVSLELAEARRGRVEGLLGDFDGRPANDLVVRGGGVIPPRPSFDDLYHRLAGSWRVAQAGSLFDYGPGESTATFTDPRFPARFVSAADLPNRAAAEAICRQAGVTRPPTLEACILDVGLTGQAVFAADAAVAQKLLLGSGAAALVVAQPGVAARRTFWATAGQKIFVDVPSSTLPDQCNVLSLLDPAGQSLAAGCIINGKGYIDGTVLPAAGQYTILVTPAEGKTGTAQLRLITDVDQAGTIAPDGPEVMARIGQPGAVARLRFTAAAGQKVFLDVPTSTLPDECNMLTLLDPAGQSLATGCIINGQGYIDGTVLPRAGQYTLLVDPGEKRTGTAQLRLVTAVDQVGAISPGGPEVTARVDQPGAVTRLRFAAAAGQKVSLDVSSSTLPDQCNVVTLLDPAGRSLAAGCIINGKGSIESTVLPASGQYTILVDPADRKTGTARLRLHG